MAETEPSTNIRDLAELLKPFGEASGRIIEGIYSTPWTGVPFTLIVLSAVDPTGQLTLKFLANLGSFITALVKAGAELIDTFQGNLHPPPPTVTAGTGGFCFTADIDPTLRNVISFLVPGGALTPDAQLCFADAPTRDKALQDFKNRLGGLVGFYRFTVTNP